MMIMKISMVMVMMIMGIIRMMRLKNGNYYENLSNDSSMARYGNI